MTKTIHYLKEGKVVKIEKVKTIKEAQEIFDNYAGSLCIRDLFQRLELVSSVRVVVKSLSRVYL